jgi:hypothetical protein
MPVYFESFQAKSRNDLISIMMMMMDTNYLTSNLTSLAG